MQHVWSKEIIQFNTNYENGVKIKIYKVAVMGI